MFPMFALEKKGNRLVTLYHSDRLPREVWEAFRATATANSRAWVDEVAADARRLHAPAGPRRKADAMN